MKVKPASENIFLLSFDYNFAAIPESNGPIYMRAGMQRFLSFFKIKKHQLINL